MPSFKPMFPTRLGRDVYNDESISGLARAAVDDLASFILADASVPDDMPFPMPETTIRMIVDGSFVVHNPDTNPTYLEDVYCPDSKTVVQYHRGGDGIMNLQVRGKVGNVTGNMNEVYTQIMRIYRLEGGVWNAYIIDNVTSDKVAEPVPDKTLKPIPEDQLFVYPNGRGLLYWAQHVYNGVEETRHTMRWVTRLKNLLPIITGNTGSPEAATLAFNTAENAVVLPDATVNRAVAGNMVYQLQQADRVQREDFANAMNIIDSRGANRPVASDREMRMRAMVLYVQRVRDQLTAIYKSFEKDVEFVRFIIRPAEERMKEFELLQAVNATNFLSADEYKERVLKLVV